MLNLKAEKNSEAVGIAFRISATAPVGARPSHKLLPSQVVDKYWEVAESVGQVAFSTDVAIDVRAYPNIQKIILFANSKGQEFLCQADVADILTFEEPAVPASVTEELQVPEWRGQPKKTWLILRNFRQLDIESCELELLNKPCLLRDQIRVPRFRTCFVKL